MGGSSQPTGGGSTIDPAIRDAVISNYNFGSGLAAQPYQPYTGQTIANQNATQQAARQAGIGMFNTGQQVLGTTLSNLGQFQSGMMNPYENQVIQNSIGDMNTARMMSLGQNADAATKARAFGGSRHGVADSLTNQGFIQNVGNMASQARQQGWEQNMGRALQAAQMTPGMVQSMYGNVEQLGNIGAQQNAIEQAQLDQAYQQFQEARAFPQQQLALRSSALMGGFGGTYQPPQTVHRNQFGQMIGGAAAGASIGGPWGAAAGGLLGAIM
jgi:hypothetical protein